MRTSALTSLFLLISPALLLASSAPSDVVFRPVPTGSGCPVSLSVQRTSATEMVNAADSAQHRRSQRIHLAFDPLDTSGILRAELTVHATSPAAHIFPAGQTAPTTDSDRDFHLSGSGLSGLREKSLWIDDAGSVVSVDLTSITYLNGSTWRASSNSTCRAVPSLYLLVGAETVQGR